MEQVAQYDEIAEIETGIRRCQFSILEDSIRIGQYLSRAKKLLDHGEYLVWVEKFMTNERAGECMWLCEAYGDPDAEIYHLLHDANIKSKSHALLFRRLAESQIADVLMCGRLGDVPLREVGALSVRDLDKKIREIVSLPAPATPLPAQAEIHFSEHIHRPLVDGVAALQEAQDRIGQWVRSEGDDLTRKKERDSLVALIDEIDGFVYRARLLVGGAHG